MKLQVCTIGALVLICVASEVLGLGLKSGGGERVECCPALLPSSMGWGQDLKCPPIIGHELFVCTQELCGKDTCKSNDDCGAGNVCCCRECNNKCLEGVASTGSGARIG